MKKLLLSITATLFVMAGSVACKKNKDCVCTYEGLEITSTAGLTKAQCKSLEIAGGVECSLK